MVNAMEGAALGEAIYRSQNGGRPSSMSMLLAKCFVLWLVGLAIYGAYDFASSKYREHVTRQKLQAELEARKTSAQNLADNNLALAQHEKRIRGFAGSTVYGNASPGGKGSAGVWTSAGTWQGTVNCGGEKYGMRLMLRPEAGALQGLVVLFPAMIRKDSADAYWAFDVSASEQGKNLQIKAGDRVQGKPRFQPFDAEALLWTSITPDLVLGDKGSCHGHLYGMVDPKALNQYVKIPSGPYPRLSGTWEGSYTCSQGPTGLTLNLSSLADSVTGTVAFHPLPGKTGPTGSYTVSGSYDKRKLVLKSGEWIERPEGYSMVDIAIDSMDEVKGVMAGKILFQGCGKMSAQRA